MALGGWSRPVCWCCLCLSSGRQWISERLVPDPRMNRQLELAQQALVPGQAERRRWQRRPRAFRIRAGRRSRPDDGAEQGLVDVRDAAIERAQSALARHRLLQASEQPGAGRGLVGAAGATAATAGAPARPGGGVQRYPRPVGGGDGPGVRMKRGARPCSSGAAVDAENAVALEGRGALFARWLGQAEACSRPTRCAKRSDWSRRWSPEDPGHVDLPLVQGELGEAMASIAARSRRELELAQADERAGRIDSAADRYCKLSRQAMTPLQARKDWTGWRAGGRCRRNGRPRISSSGAPMRRWKRRRHCESAGA